MNTFLLVFSGFGAVIGAAMLVHYLFDTDIVDNLEEKSRKTNMMLVGFCVFGICFSEFLMSVARCPGTRDPDFLISLSTVVILLTVMVTILRVITLIIRAFKNKDNDSFDE